LRDAEIEITPEDAVVAGAAGIAVASLFASALSIRLVPVVGVAAAAAGPVGLAFARGRGQRRFVAALPGFVELVSARLRGGHTVPTALADAAGQRDPVANDVRRVLRRLDHGETLEGALRWWAAERASDPVRAVAGSLAVAAGTGGVAAEAVEGLARSLREQLGARAEAASLSAQARLSAVVVGLAPIAYLVFASAIDPAAASTLVSTSGGRICLVMGLVLDLLGVWWMRRIVRSEV
jgi:tight adherence protein B